MRIPCLSNRASNQAKWFLAIAIGTPGLVWAGQARAAQALIDFGAAATPTTTDGSGRTWNNVNDANDVSGSPFTLTSTTGIDSGYRLTISNPPGTTNAIGFNGANSNGTTAPTGTAAARGYPATATEDSLYGNTASFNGSVVQAVRLTLTGLSAAEQYNLDFFASRTGAGGDVRQTQYAVTGGNGSTTVFLNASENTGTLASATGVTPDTNGRITIDVSPGPANTNANGFFYLGVLELNSSPVPEPASLVGIGAATAVGLLARRRRTPAAEEMRNDEC